MMESEKNRIMEVVPIKRLEEEIEEVQKYGGDLSDSDKSALLIRVRHYSMNVELRSVE
ncbi:MAG: hypothetical protein R6V50_07610 [Thermoplasmatota archaeon]